MTQIRRKTSDWQLTNLGAMVDHVIGLTAYKFSKGELLSKRIAAAIFASPSQWTNMKTGKLPIDVEKLGRLTDHLQLNKRYGLTYKVFLVPTMEEFEALLKEHGVGNGSDYDRSRHTIFQAWKSGPAGHGGIVLKKASLKMRGGMGDAGAPPPANPLFAINDNVVVHVSHPANGYLIVLNDDMASNRVVCMAPSCYAPHLAANGRSSVIPAEDIEPSVIPMYGPGGHYRLYALWTATEPTQLGFTDPAAAMVSAPYLLSLTDFQQFANYVDHQRRRRRQEDTNRTQLLIADYWVQSGTAQGA